MRCPGLGANAVPTRACCSSRTSPSAAGLAIAPACHIYLADERIARSELCRFLMVGGRLLRFRNMPKKSPMGFLPMSRLFLLGVLFGREPIHKTCARADHVSGPGAPKRRRGNRPSIVVRFVTSIVRLVTPIMGLIVVIMIPSAVAAEVA